MAAAVAGAAASIGLGHFSHRPEALALLGFLFVGLTLAMVRQEYHIAAIEGHLVDPDAFRAHAIVQARWTEYKARDILDKGSFGLVAFIAQAGGLFVVPGLAAIACTWAALSDSPDGLVYAIVSLTGILVVLLAVAVVAVYSSYQNAVNKAEALHCLAAASAPTEDLTRGCLSAEQNEVSRSSHFVLIRRHNSCRDAAATAGRAQRPRAGGTGAG